MYGWYVPVPNGWIRSSYYNQDGDETTIYDSAQALVTLQKLFGPFPRILGKGNFALVSLGTCEGPLPVSTLRLTAALAVAGQGVHPASHEQRSLNRSGQV